MSHLKLEVTYIDTYHDFPPKRLIGVDLIDVPGISSLSALYLIGEIGLDMTRWKNEKQFASWLGLCPGNKFQEEND